MKSETLLYSRYFTYIKPIIRLPVVKNYGPTIFTLIASAVFIFFAIKPTIATILVLQKQIDDANQILEQATQKVNSLSLAKKNYDELDENIKQRITTAIPNAISLQSLIQNLEQSALLHQASISALQIQPLVISTVTEKTPNSLSEISFTFNIEGGYVNLIGVLQDLKRSSRLISIQNLSISKVADTEGLIMSISGKAYYLK